MTFYFVDEDRLNTDVTTLSWMIIALLGTLIVVYALVVLTQQLLDLIKFVIKSGLKFVRWFRERDKILHHVSNEPTFRDNTSPPDLSLDVTNNATLDGAKLSCDMVDRRKDSVFTYE